MNICQTAAAACQTCGLSGDAARDGFPTWRYSVTRSHQSARQLGGSSGPADGGTLRRADARPDDLAEGARGTFPGSLTSSRPRPASSSFRDADSAGSVRTPIHHRGTGPSAAMQNPPGVGGHPRRGHRQTENPWLSGRRGGQSQPARAACHPSCRRDSTPARSIRWRIRRSTVRMERPSWDAARRSEIPASSRARTSISSSVGC